MSTVNDQGQLPLRGVGKVHPFATYPERYPEVNTASQPRARTTDPDTSKAAARSVREPSAVQKAILFILREIHTWGASDLVIAQTYKLRQESMGKGVYPPCSESGLRTRRAELVDRGLVRDSDRRMKLPSGRSAIIWEAV